MAIVFIQKQMWLSNEILQLPADKSGNANLGCGAYF
jgi:hypothetical protein